MDRRGCECATDKSSRTEVGVGMNRMRSFAAFEFCIVQLIAKDKLRDKANGVVLEQAAETMYRCQNIIFMVLGILGNFFPIWALSGM